ncbi:hypothetical protein PCASD_17838 [Puccinia coronata f. sp. avenae]|uniref:Uncharacterized protein n=1 Tax=Puccinia coronata f. sp. avenae TaxID=200324 RepID=A0A2N5TTJ2_9BASI|nr:hypothetical protein PCASD_17838 [Puccinia coronata f. sp. avenae]
MSAADAPSGAQPDAEIVPDATSTSDAPSDSTSHVDKRSDQIVKLLGDLHQTWGGQLQDARERVETPEVLSADELAQRKKLLFTIQAQLMPSLKQQIRALLASVGLRPSVDHPEPNLDQTWELVSQLGPALDVLHKSIVSLTPWYIPGPDDKRTTHTHIDQKYGEVKKFRCDRLYVAFFQLAGSSISPLLQAYSRYLREGLSLPNSQVAKEIRTDIVDWTEECCRDITDWLTLSCLSDYGFLQRVWKQHVENLDTYVEEAREQLTKVGLQHRMHEWGMDLVSKLFRHTVTIGDILQRTFLPLLDPHYQNIIKFDENLSSNELEWVVWEAGLLVAYFDFINQGLARLLQHFGPDTHEFVFERLEESLENLRLGMYLTKSGAIKVHNRLDSLLTLISFHHVRSTAAIQGGINLFRSAFAAVRKEFIVAMKDFRSDYQGVEDLVGRTVANMPEFLDET